MKTIKEQIIPDNFKNIIANAIDRAANAVGVITILSTIAIFGIFTLFWGLGVSIWITIFFFGVSGIFEVFHIQRIADLNKRISNVQESNLVEKLAFARKVGDVKIVEQVSYRGFLFNGIGFEKLPITVGVSQPLCPKCKRPVVMDAKVKFPGRTKIRYFCLCGFEQFGRLTTNEMRMQVGKALNEPRGRAG